MTLLVTAVILALLHATIVVVAMAVARVFIPARLAASRATLGVVGMACILLVTGLALLPLPGVWPRQGWLYTATARSEPLSDLSNAVETADENAAVSTDMAQESSLAPAGRVQLSLDWLALVGNRVERAAHVGEWPGPWKRQLVLVLLLAGVTVGLARLGLALQFMRRLRRTSTPIDDSRILKVLDDLKRRCDCRRPIELRETARLASAATGGWLRPVIFLPSQWRQWSADELTAVLAHEVAHTARGDYIARIIAAACTAVHFYHPLVRRSARQLAADQEFAADRLAGSLCLDAQDYARGLARLALRYHESLPDRPAWSSVSIMPNASDFLARRLEMLRVRNDSKGRNASRLIARSASACLVVVSLLTAILRGAADDDQPTDRSVAPVAETARRDQGTTAAATPTDAPRDDKELFARAPFDPAMVRPGQNGCFLIRVGELLRHPEVAPRVETLNKQLAIFLRQFIGDVADSFDAREIEWIAGDLIVSVKPPLAPGENGRYMFGSGGVVIRTTQASDWQAVLLESFPGATRKEFGGKSYVQLPTIPSLGPAPVLMRSPDEHTLIYRISTKGDVKDAAAETKFLTAFFDDSPKTCPWASSWRAVDCGLITLVFDNSQTGWQDLPKEAKDYSAVVAPLLEKTKYVALGIDWTEKSNRTAARLRTTCADRESVKDVHLAAMTALSQWPILLLDGGDFLAQYQKRLLQFLASITVLSSAGEEGEPFIQAAADVAWDADELVRILGDIWYEEEE